MAVVWHLPTHHRPREVGELLEPPGCDGHQPGTPVRVPVRVEDLGMAHVTLGRQASIFWSISAPSAYQRINP